MTTEYQIVFHYIVRIIVSITWWETDGCWVGFSQRIHVWVDSLKTTVTIGNLIWAIVNECDRSIWLPFIRLFCWIGFVIHRITSKCKSESLGFLDSLYRYCKVNLSHRRMQLSNYFSWNYYKKHVRSFDEIIVLSRCNWVPRKFRFTEKFLIHKEYL